MRSVEGGDNEPLIIGDDIRFALEVVKASAKYAREQVPKEERPRKEIETKHHWRALGSVGVQGLNLLEKVGKIHKEPIHWNAEAAPPPAIKEDSTRRLGLVSAQGLEYALDRFLAIDKITLPKERNAEERALAMLEWLKPVIEELKQKNTADEEISQNSVWGKIRNFAKQNWR